MKIAFYFVLLGGLGAKLEVMGALSGGCVTPYSAWEVAEGPAVTGMQAKSLRRSAVSLFS